MRINTVFWGAFLILVGILLVLNNLGWITVNVWGVIFSVFLIILGAGLIWGLTFRKDLVVEHKQVPLQGARKARLIIKHGAGRLQIFANPSDDVLLDGDFSGGVDVDTRLESNEVETYLRTPSHFFLPVMWWPGGMIEWSIRFVRNVPLDLRLDVGANEARIDLEHLLVTEFSLKTGASSSDITMPASAGFTRASISSGLASVIVRIPQGVAARIQGSIGLASMTVDRHRFPRQGRYYQSNDYETAENKIDLRIETGLGSVDVR